MIPNYPYIAMLVTGSLHLVLGVGVVITAIIGLLVGPCSLGFSAGALIEGAWVLLVASLGIATGVRMKEDMKIQKAILFSGGSSLPAEWQDLAAEKIHHLKSAYMVTAILSACLFSTGGFGLFITVLLIAEDSVCRINLAGYMITGGVGMLISVLEWILAIVSSIICCCCSSTNTTPIVQAPVPGPSRIQYQSLPNTTSVYHQPINTMQNQTPGYGATLTNPPAYQPYDATDPRQ